MHRTAMISLILLLHPSCAASACLYTWETKILVATTFALDSSPKLVVFPCPCQIVGIAKRSKLTSLIFHDRTAVPFHHPSCLSPLKYDECLRQISCWPCMAAFPSDAWLSWWEVLWRPVRRRSIAARWTRQSEHQCSQNKQTQCQRKPVVGKKITQVKKIV